MRIVPLRKNKYDIIVKYVNKIKRMGVFSKFNSSNVIIFNSNSLNGAVTFVNDPISGNYGLSFFIGDNGLNTLSDMFMISDESFNMSSFYLTNVIYKKECNLEPQDYDYFNKHNIPVKRINNVVFNTYEEGFAMYTSTSDIADKVFELLCSLYIVLMNKFDFIEEVFKREDKVILTSVDFANLTFTVNESDLPYLEKKLEYQKYTEEEHQYFEGINNENYEMYLITRGGNTPISIKECNKAVTPLLVSFNRNELPLDFFDVIISLPSDWRTQIIFLLKDYFQAHGIPKKIVINNRKLYFGLYELLSSFGIECVMQLENPQYDLMLDDINVSLFDEYPYTIRDQDLCKIPEDLYRKTISYIKKFFGLYFEDSLFDLPDEVLNNTTIKRLINIITQTQNMVDDEYEEITDNDTDLIS